MGFYMAARPTQHFTKGQAIITEGSIGDRTFRILSGEVLICKRNQAQELVPIATLGNGDMFGEMYLLDQALTRNATVIATSGDVTVEVFFHEEMQTLFNRLTPRIKALFHGYNSRLKHVSSQCAQVQSSRPVTQLPDGTLRPGMTRLQS